MPCGLISFLHQVDKAEAGVDYTIGATGTVVTIGEDLIVTALGLLNRRSSGRQQSTISSGAVPYTSGWIELAPESGASDELHAIAAGTLGAIVYLTTAVPGTHQILIRHNIGNLQVLGGTDFTLSFGTAIAIWNGSDWEVSPGITGAGVYQLLSEKGMASGYASLDSAVLVEEPVKRIQSGLLSARPTTPPVSTVFAATDVERHYIFL